jgi:hypothetical protein
MECCWKAFQAIQVAAKFIRYRGIPRYFRTVFFTKNIKCNTLTHGEENCSCSLCLPTMHRNNSTRNRPTHRKGQCLTNWKVQPALSDNGSTNSESTNDLPASHWRCSSRLRPLRFGRFVLFLGMQFTIARTTLLGIRPRKQKVMRHELHDTFFSRNATQVYCLPYVATNQCHYSIASSYFLASSSLVRSSCLVIRKW